MRTNTTAAQLRAEADKLQARAAESRQRCGADGMLTQRAAGLSADERRLEAAIIERGGVWDFPALFGLDGNLVPARLEFKEARFGGTRKVWRLLDANGRTAGWFNPSEAMDRPARVRNNAKKGYYVGRVIAAAKAELAGNNILAIRAIPVRTDGGWNADVEIVDNGQRDERAEIIAAYQAAWTARDHRAIAAMEAEADKGGYVAELIAARKTA
ncbi:hypothetical protein [Frankia sp. CcI49]|uniref:hypothetical protein n=1 Tax=Frankia sp. CcI49 TaxID=1745382 RepID=UPI0013045E34|nr:hypothetical protein [Frankia sp. CcI49]